MTGEFWLSEERFRRLAPLLPTDTRGVARVDEHAEPPPGDKLVADEIQVQRWLGSDSNGAGARAPNARLRPFPRLTARPTWHSSREDRHPAGKRRRHGGSVGTRSGPVEPCPQGRVRFLHLYIQPPARPCTARGGPAPWTSAVSII